MLTAANSQLIIILIGFLVLIGSIFSGADILVFD